MNTAELKNFCTEVRRDIINMTANAGSGHPGGSLSVVEMMSAIFCTQMRVDPKTGRPMWDLDAEGKPDPWRADSYLFGVWDLLTGKESEGYARLEECVRHNSDYMKDRLKEFPNACDDPRDAMAVMYRNAQLFLETKEISDVQKRRDAIRETYEEVCRFMRYYHGLAKKTERS